MRREYIIKMSTTERLEYEKICKETYDILQAIADKISNSNERANFWSKIRKFNMVSDVFKE